MSQGRADDLAAFVGQLRQRLERGELAGHAPIDLGNGHTLVDVQLAVQVMLASYDRYLSMRPDRRRQPINLAQARLLADNLRRLRERLVD